MNVSSKLFTHSLFLVAIFVSSYVKARELPKLLPTDDNIEIDIYHHIFGHKFGITKNDFIKNEGEPDGRLKLGDGSLMLIYGKHMGFIVCTRGMGEKPSPLGEDFEYACGNDELPEIVA